MEVIREIVKVHNRRFTMNLPEHFSDTEVEVLVLPLDRTYRTSVEDKEQELAADLRETIHEVKLMRAGKSPKKSAKELICEL